MNTTDQLFLLKSARQSILQTLQTDIAVTETDVPQQLQTELACFVTLKINNQLRGCIGNLQPVGPLYESVCRNACSAAFQDPRFPALTLNELNNVVISISILSKPEPMDFQSENDLKKQLHINKDGLIIQTNHQRATFLPAVWENIPTKDQFLTELKNKAGIAAHEMVEQAWVYQTESFSE